MALNIINKEIRNDILLLESDVKILRTLRDIEKTLLSMGAYSEKNMEKQEMLFENAQVPEWEKIINRQSWNTKRKYVHTLYKRYSKIIESMEKTFIDDGGNIDNKPKL